MADFEKQLSALESVVERLEQGDLSLEESVHHQRQVVHGKRIWNVLERRTRRLRVGRRLDRSGLVRRCRQEHENRNQGERHPPIVGARGE